MADFLVVLVGAIGIRALATIWFSRLTPSQKVLAVDQDRRFRERLAGFRIGKVSRGP